MSGGGGGSGRELELTLDALAFGGDAVGRDAGGRVVFVAAGAPGDRVIARVVEEKRSFARAELVRVVTPGAARMAAPCPIAGECGGCPWQHVAPEAQLAAKQEIVRRALVHICTNVQPIVPAPAWLGYRVRARMTARGGRVGFQARRSHRVVDVDACPALDPALVAALQRARRALSSAAGSARAAAVLGEGGAIEGLVRDGHVHLALIAGERADRRALAAARRELAAAAEPVGFSQANAAQNETLRALVRAAVAAPLTAGSPSTASPRILELYAGDGNFTRDLRRLGPVVAVESDRAAAERLRRIVTETATATASGGGGAVRVVAAPVARALRELAGERFDVVVLDPPRIGAADAIDGIVALGAARVVYVSCDPMTLARDLTRLVAHGYAVDRAQPIDMMPHTSHVEVVATLTRQ